MHRNRKRRDLSSRSLSFYACRVALALIGSGSSCLSQTGVVEPLPAGGHRVLFIGNSLTYVNDLPRTLTDLAASVGDTIKTAMVAFPDFALEDHARDGRAPRAIAVGGWEYVVLQQGPSSLDESRANLISWTKYFDALIRPVGARTALYMVWPDQASSGSFPRVGGSYLFAAQAVGGVFWPAGLAWYDAWQVDSNLPLYGPDGFHPSALGTYLVAAEMYERITGGDARNLPARAVVAGRTLDTPEATIRVLQNAVHQANLEYPAESVKARSP